MSKSSLDQIRSLAADVLGVDVSQLSASSSPETVDVWDSVQHLSLVLAFEQQFDIQLEPEEIEAMKTLGGIAAIVDRKRAAGA